ncbi:hypothetical protein ES703_17442 [subsurface metagenome]
MRELLNLKIKKISLVGSPASRERWILKKSQDSGNFEEIIEAVNDYLEDDLTAIELTKAVDKDKFLGAIALLKKYRPDMPDDVQASIDRLVKYAVQSFGYGEYPPVEKGEEEEIKKSQNWDSFKMPGESTSIRFEVADDVEEDPDDPDNDEFLDPLERQLAGINKRLSSIEKGDNAIDKWKSFEVVGGHFISSERLAKMIPEPKKEPVKKDELQRPMGVKTGIESEGAGYDDGRFPGYRKDPDDKWSSWIL